MSVRFNPKYICTSVQALNIDYTCTGCQVTMALFTKPFFFNTVLPPTCRIGRTTIPTLFPVYEEKKIVFDECIGRI